MHQLPEPIATAGTDRNFYDRYFFNGYTPDGSVFFAAALGVYPHLNVMDAAFSVIVDGVQHNLHASRLLNMERMDTQVGPISVEVIEPLQAPARARGRQRAWHQGRNHVHTRVRCRWRSRASPIRQGPRTIMDYTRLTQNGTYEGWIEVEGKRIEIDARMVLGTRDRSWGVRPDRHCPIRKAWRRRGAPQFYWLWAPLNFPDRFMLYHNNADGDGHGMEHSVGDWRRWVMRNPCTWRVADPEVIYKSGTRHATGAFIETADADGRATGARS